MNLNPIVRPVIDEEDIVKFAARIAAVAVPRVYPNPRRPASPAIPHAEEPASTSHLEWLFELVSGALRITQHGVDLLLDERLVCLR